MQERKLKNKEFDKKLSQNISEVDEKFETADNQKFKPDQIPYNYLKNGQKNKLELLNETTASVIKTNYMKSKTYMFPGIDNLEDEKDFEVNNGYTFSYVVQDKVQSESHKAETEFKKQYKEHDYYFQYYLRDLFKKSYKPAEHTTITTIQKEMIQNFHVLESKICITMKENKDESSKDIFEADCDTQSSAIWFKINKTLRDTGFSNCKKDGKKLLVCNDGVIKIFTLVKKAKDQRIEPSFKLVNIFMLNIDEISEQFPKFFSSNGMLKKEVKLKELNESTKDFKKGKDGKNSPIFKKWHIQFDTKRDYLYCMSEDCELKIYHLTSYNNEGFKQIKQIDFQEHFKKEKKYEYTKAVSLEISTRKNILFLGITRKKNFLGRKEMKHYSMIENKDILEHISKLVKRNGLDKKASLTIKKENAKKKLIYGEEINQEQTYIGSIGLIDIEMILNDCEDPENLFIPKIKKMFPFTSHEPEFSLKYLEEKELLIVGSCVNFIQAFKIKTFETNLVSDQSFKNLSDDKKIITNRLSNKKSLLSYHASKSNYLESFNEKSLWDQLCCAKELHDKVLRLFNVKLRSFLVQNEEKSYFEIKFK